MAITPQIPGQAILQSVPAVIDTLSKPVIFGEEFNDRQTPLDAAKAFTNYFGRVHKKYNNIDTTEIEVLVNRLFQEQDSAFMNLVRDKTLLKDTFINRLFIDKTPLGEVLCEVQNAQESPHRKLLSKDIFNKAEIEARELTKKEIALAPKKEDRKQISNEISLLQKRNSLSPQKIGAEFQINSHLLSDKSSVSVASLNNGSFVATWTSFDQDGSGPGAYGQIFNANGSKKGSEFLVNTYTNGTQGGPSGANLNNGTFVVTWMSDGQDGSGSGVYGQIFNANGSKNGSEFLVNTYTTGYQYYPVVASSNNGTFVVAWASNGQDGSGSGVYGQVFNANGTKSGSEFQVNTYTTGTQDVPSVASLNNGTFVATWQSDSQDGDNYGVYGQIFNADGSKNGSEFQVNTYTNSMQAGSSVASLNNGTFVVTWMSYGQDGSDAGVYGQIFNADGSINGSEFQVNTYTINSQSSPSVASLNNGTFVVTWNSLYQDGIGEGVFGQIFNADGTKSGSEFQVNTGITGQQYFPSVTNLINNTFVVAWNAEGGSLNGIVGQIFETINITTTSSSKSSTLSSSNLSNKESEKINSSDHRIFKIKIIATIIAGSIGVLFGSLTLTYLYFRKRKKNQKPVTMEPLSLERPKTNSEIFELEKSGKYGFYPDFPQEGTNPEGGSSGVSQQYLTPDFHQEGTNPERVRPGISQQYQLTPDFSQEGTNSEGGRSGVSQQYQLTPVFSQEGSNSEVGLSVAPV